MSVQRAAAFVLDQYVRDFPALERHAAAELSVRRYEALLTAKLAAMHSRAAAAAAAVNANAAAGCSNNNNNNSAVGTYPRANFGGGGSLNTINCNGTMNVNACPYNDVQCAECARCARCQFYNEYASSNAAGCPQPTLTVPPPPPPPPPPLPTHQPLQQHQPPTSTQSQSQSATAGTQTSTPEQQTGADTNGGSGTQSQSNKTQLNGKAVVNSAGTGTGAGLANGEVDGEPAASEERREYPAQEDVLFVRSNGGASPVGPLYQNLRPPTGTIPIPIAEDLSAPAPPSGALPEANNNNIPVNGVGTLTQNSNADQSMNATLEHISMQPLGQQFGAGSSICMGAGAPAGACVSAPLPALAAGDICGGGVGGDRESPPSPTRFLTAHPTLYPPQLSRKQIRQLAEWELERRLARRRARLLVAAEEVFARVRRVIVPQPSRRPHSGSGSRSASRESNKRAKCRSGSRQKPSAATAAGMLLIDITNGHFDKNFSAVLYSIHMCRDS